MEHILIVEDDVSLRRLFSRVLTDEGYQVEVAEDGQEAMNALENNPPHVMVLDMNIPFISGFEIIRFVRNHDELKDIRIVVVSANTNVPSTDEAEMADVVLLKPVSMEQLKTMVSRMAGTG